MLCFLSYLVCEKYVKKHLFGSHFICHTLNNSMKLISTWRYFNYPSLDTKYMVIRGFISKLSLKLDVNTPNTSSIQLIHVTIFIQWHMRGKNLVFVEIKSVTLGCYNSLLTIDISLAFAQDIFLVHRQIPEKMHLPDFEIWKITVFDKIQYSEEEKKIMFFTYIFYVNWSQGNEN